MRPFLLFLSVCVSLFFSGCTTAGTDRVAGGADYNSYVCRGGGDYSLTPGTISDEVISVHFECNHSGKIVIDERFTGPNMIAFKEALQEANDSVIKNVTVVTRNDSDEIIQIYQIDGYEIAYIFFWDECEECATE